MPPLADEQEKPEWEIRSVDLRSSEGEEVTRTTAKVYGCFAVHKQDFVKNPLAATGVPEVETRKIPKVTYWFVTHVDSGLTIVRVGDSDSAKAIAEVLHDTALPGFEESTNKYVIRHRLPKWVKPWVKACWDSNEYVDPQPFKLQALRETRRLMEEGRAREEQEKQKKQRKKKGRE